MNCSKDEISRCAVGYSEYVSNEIKLMTLTTEKQIKLLRQLNLGIDDTLLRMALLLSIQNIKSKETLVYFLQHQERLVREQEKTMKEYGLV